VSIMRSRLAAVRIGLVAGGVAFAWAVMTHAPATAGAAAQPESGLPKPVSCVGLSAPVWKGEVDTSIDMENGLLTIVYYGAGESSETVTVRYDDQACIENPTLRDLIKHVVATAKEDIAADCADLKERLATGNFTARGRSLNPDAIVAYIERWC
jgi:hypothetical protein